MATKWVRKNKFANDTGLTEKAIDRKREECIWVEGVHWKKIGREIYYNEEEFDKWVEAA